MTTADRLLPPQATPLERAVVQVAPNWEDLATAGANLESTRPPEFAPWLAAEWALAPFADLFPSSAALIDAGLPWLFERGSSASVRRVLGWLGFEAGVRIEEDQAYLHIDLGRVASSDEIARIAQAVRASLPAHMRFYRVYFEHDLRPVRLDRGPALDAGLLDDDSGLWIGDVKASFAQRHRSELQAPAIAGIDSAASSVRFDLLSYDDRPLLDAWRLDSHILVDAFAGLAELRSRECSPSQQAAPERANGSGTTGAVEWSAPEPDGATSATQAMALPVPAFPPRRWHGLWSGPWRQSIELKASEES